MSVAVRDRSKSQLDYYYNAVKLQVDITQLLLRDFGVKDKVRDVNFYAKINRMSDDDAKKFCNLPDKYNLGSKIAEEYPQWLIDKLRDQMMDALGKMLECITLANSLQTINNLRQFYDRQSNINRAIGYCKDLLRIMQYALRILPIDCNKLMPYVGAILQEIEDLKHYRKKTNKDQKKIRADKVTVVQNPED